MSAARGSGMKYVTPTCVEDRQQHLSNIVNFSGCKIREISYLDAELVLALKMRVPQHVFA
jgi:hypothetical protein